MGLRWYVNQQTDAIITLHLGTAFILILATVAFQRYRRLAIIGSKKKADRCIPLDYNTLDDSPRNYVLKGFRTSGLGYTLQQSWIAFCTISYIFTAVGSGLTYVPWVLNLFAVDPSDGQEWNYFVTMWCAIFATIHIMLLVFVLMWKPLRTRFMIPVSDMSIATHVMVEELSDSNSNVDNLSAASFPSSFFTWVRRMKTALVLPVESDGTADGKLVVVACVQYRLSKEASAFYPTGVTHFKPRECHIKLERGGNTEAEARNQIIECGQNMVDVIVPSVIESLWEEFFQLEYIIASVGVFSYNVNTCWNIGLFWLFLNVVAGCYKSLLIVRPNRQKIRDLATMEETVEVLRDGRWRVVKSDAIALGDIVAIGEGTVPVDGLLISGGFVVNESSLTGEPMPVQKLPVENSANATINKSSQIYAGTTCMQCFGPRDDKVIVLVTAVGASTARGALVRIVLFPSEVCWKIDNQMSYVYLISFIWIMLLLGIHCSPLVDMVTVNGTFLFVANLVAFCICPMMPVAITMGKTAACERLQKHHSIQCLQPDRIPIAGKISLMVFDKTGTITKEGMDFIAVVPVDSARFLDTVGFAKEEERDAAYQNAKTVKTKLSEVLRTAVVSTHTVTSMRDGTLVGNQVEVAMVSATGWKVGAEKIESPDGSETVEIVRKLEFDHCRMTSGVVVRRPGSEYMDVFVKGSYEKIDLIADRATVPPDYKERTCQLAKEGYYVLGLAHKRLPAKMPIADVIDLRREDLEDGLCIIGLLQFRNEMKVDSPEAIEALTAGDIESVICTGDNPLTGISIGRQCGIVRGDRVLLGDIPANGTMIEWRDADGGSHSVDFESKEYRDCQLAVTQSAWRQLVSEKQQSLLSKIWPRIYVYGRMKPEDKVNVVKYYQQQGLVTGMCGDGGNDCGGLRMAHAGIALSEAEASLVAPFSTGRDGKSLVAVVDLVREGRACLATNLSSYQYFMVYSFYLSGMRLYLNVTLTVSMGEYVWILMDIVIGGLLVWAATRSGPAPKLSDHRPTSNLFGIRTVSSALVPLFMGFFMIGVGSYLLQQKEWFISFDPLEAGVDTKWWAKRGDNQLSAVCVLILFLTYANCAYAGTYGGNFRKNVLLNPILNFIFVGLIALVVFLLWAPTSSFHCLFRVNCDNQNSLSAKDKPFFIPFAKFSTSGVGGCFMGPQLLLWQQNEIGEDVSLAEKAAWVDELEKRDCIPLPESLKISEQRAETNDTECEGANNCFSTEFKIELTVLFAVCILLNHIFVVFVLNGFVAKWIRTRIRSNTKNNVELAAKSNAVPLNSPM